MNNSNFRTRGNTTSFGKTKVYISGSDNGIKLHLKKIEDIVLSEFNCAVWHNYPEIIKDTQVLLVLIERVILEQKNETVEKEIESAIENHIPIIPILLEEGLNQLYFNKYENKEYLDFATAEKEDKNKERFRNNLEKYIFDDDMMQQIKHSFRTSIFFSYRKQESKHAETFLEKVHEDKALQETAIWYDGFLTPGEDYTDEISEKIAECDLFVLSLTASLLDPDNYVLKYEIPAAEEKKKKILLVEMEEFDYSSNPVINKLLKNCPIVSILDTNRMCQIILKMLPPVKSVDDFQNIRNRYLMGYGYLSGYSVEKNNTIAYLFIEEAANDGYPPAMEKLSNMYNDGDGVVKDIDLSLKWNEKYVDSLHKLSITNQENKDNELLFNEVKKLIQRYQKYKKYKEANYRIKHLDPENVQNPDIRSSIYLLKGDLAHQYNDNIAAFEYYNKSLKIRTERLENAKSPEEIRLLNQQIGHCYNRLGDVFSAESKFQQALNQYFLALENRRMSEEDEPTPKNRRDYSVTLIRMADVFLVVNQANDGLRYMEEALPIRISLNEEMQTMESATDLAVAYSRYAKVNTHLEKFAEAEDSFKKSLELSKMVLKEHEMDAAAIGVASTYYDLGEMYGLQNKNYDAISCCAEGIEICDGKKWKENYVLRETRARFHVMNGLLWLTLELEKEGIEQFICAAEIRSELAQKKYLNGLDFRTELQSLAQTYRDISTYIREEGKLYFFEMEKEAWKQLKLEYPKVEFYTEKYEEVLKFISDIS